MKIEDFEEARKVVEKLNLMHETIRKVTEALGDGDGRITSIEYHTPGSGNRFTIICPEWVHRTVSDAILTSYLHAIRSECEQKALILSKELTRIGE